MFCHGDTENTEKIQAKHKRVNDQTKSQDSPSFVLPFSVPSVSPWQIDYFLSRSCNSTMNSLMSLKERYTEAKRT
jgi:hypothetical protein